MSDLQKLKEQNLEDDLFKRIQLLIDALDRIITTHADSGTLKAIARQALDHVLKEQ